ncbi:MULTISPECIES: sporulation membrane protein YtaF [Bacillaceae]|jgi:putative sporulation protein YtaF|uniref:Membrane protein n=2 Tax=Bacillus infantis TaxID=324767 RepID=U5LGS3_9BACI|nr:MULTISPECIES: sporulation membrane protein YtaF [Bacillus]OXT18866.1 sporulation membrane protein YtaF [Bacillus sp. OG2]AGX05787.1 membrane protein [Bacillus infantis NRRL B-14911]MCA1036493.1 sporulation membrane protein YtaF [Bacillus infantis]MCK6205069.1 sporulation membrane protein YtaF [Bacillus infantis]MCP1160049.1 sporulation membrane protein YtaF [Bacillus infantis]
MVHTLSLLMLAFAVSLDSFSVGLTYGLRKMSIPLKSILIIACCSAITLITAMTIGHVIESFLSPQAAESLGGILLILLGAWVLYQFFRPEKSKDVLPHEKTIVNFEIKSLGLVINILQKPMAADFDKSGTITGIEAFMLGLALSLDAFGAGIGAAMLGYSPGYLAAAVAAMSSLFVFAGMKIGTIFSHSSWVQRFSFIPGLLLIVIGIWKI